MLLSARWVEMNKETFRHVNYKRIWLSFCKIKEKMGNSAKKRKEFCKWFRTAEESPWFVNLEGLLVCWASLQSAWREAWKSRGCMRMVLVIDQTQVLCWLDSAFTPFSSDFFQSPVGQFKYLLETRMRAKSRWRKERDVRICIIERNITKI